MYKKATVRQLYNFFSKQMKDGNEEKEVVLYYSYNTFAIQEICEISRFPALPIGKDNQSVIAFMPGGALGALSDIQKPTPPITPPKELE
jgi:hypothetical protein